jgi:uncharacterized membrane protein
MNRCRIPVRPTGGIAGAVLREWAREAGPPAAAWALTMSEPPDHSRTDSGPPPNHHDLDARLSRLEQRLQLLEERVEQLLEEFPPGVVTGDVSAQPSVPEPAPPSVPEPTLPSVPEPTLPSVPEPTLPSAQAPADPAGASPSPPSEDLEARIGQIWVSRAGLVLVLLALAMFLKWAYDRNLISHEVRTALGVLSGLSLITLGEILHRRTARYAEAFTGAGIAALYATFFAAYSLYGLFGQTTSFAFMLLTTAAAVVFAVRYDAVVIAVLGIIGGFAVPYLLPGPDARLEGVLVYYLILQAGLMLAIPRLSRFRELLLILAVLAGFVAVAIPAGAGTPANPMMWLLYFLLLSVGIAWLTTRGEKLPATIRRPLLVILATLPFLTPAALGPKPAHPFAGVVYVLVVYVGFLVLERRTGGETPGLVSAATVAAFAASVLITSPDQSAWWIVVPVGIISILAVLSTARRLWDPSYAVVLIGGPIALSHLESLADLHLALEWIFPASMLVLMIAGGLVRRRPGPADIPLFLLTAGMFGGYLWVSLEQRELAAYHGALMLALAALHAGAAGLAARLRPGEPLLKLVLAGVGVGCLTLFFPTQFDTATVTMAWAVEAAVLVFVGLRLKQAVIWRGSWALLVLATFRYVLLDSGLIDGFGDTRPFLSAHTVAALSLVVAGLLISYWQSRAAGQEATRAWSEELAWSSGLNFCLANGILLLGMTLEIHHLFQRRATLTAAEGIVDRYPEMEQFVLTAYYALHSIILVTFGLVRSLRLVRILGLVLFAGTSLKAFAFDLKFLDTIYRVLSFLALGALLVAASFLYRRFRERLEPPGPSSP